MGTTLYNKIHLGRAPLLGSKRVQAAVLFALAATAVVAWMALQSIK